MDLSKMNHQEIEALLRLLAEFEREEMALLLRERLEAERLH
jgi:division protein CdvB (Snf7/Vps24/ESCRT-III family)